MTTQKAQKTNVDITSDLVADYLVDHPDFFLERDDLLTRLELPHLDGNTISLIEKQVAVLRDRNKVARKKLEEYVTNAKHNDDIFKKCQHLIVGLLEAEDCDSFLGNLERSFKRDFKCTAYSLLIFGKSPRQVNHFTSIIPEETAKTYVGSLIRSRKPILGVLRPKEQDFLFRHQSEKVKSAAVLSVRHHRDQIALLAIGSNNPDYFRPGMGTTFISFIADALSRLIPRYIDDIE